MIDVLLSTSIHTGRPNCYNHVVMEKSKLNKEIDAGSGYRVFTDGACSGNPGPGGWAAVLIGEGRLIELGGGERDTTNNRMEMTAALKALRYLPRKGKVVLYTDSAYLINGITKWIFGWKKKNWVKKDGKPVLNADLWRELDALNSSRVQWRHVRGHAGHYFNERCDVIAVAFSQSEPITLRDSPLKNLDDLREIESALQSADSSSTAASDMKTGSRRARPKKKSGQGQLSFLQTYKKKVYLFAWNGRVYRFDNWPACQSFSRGKKGYAKACLSREEEEAYARGAGLSARALDK